MSCLFVLSSYIKNSPPKKKLVRIFFDIRIKNVLSLDAESLYILNNLRLFTCTRTHGIFRLTTPGGMSVIRQCQQRGFHPHNQPPDGGPIYDTCTDVFLNPDLKFDVIDLR